MEVAVKKHTSLALRCLRLLPTPYQQEDSNRLSLAFFALSTLDLLGTLHANLSPEERADCQNWVYSLQQPSGGFAGSTAGGSHTTSHLVMSYCALLCLAILEDDLQRLDRPGLRSFVKSCQTSQGSFLMYPNSHEEDVRSSYCAMVILHLLPGATLADTIDLPGAIHFLHACQTYDAGFSQTPGLESQGGSTYCAIAALRLAEASIPQQDRLLSWLAQRQCSPSADMFLDEDEEISFSDRKQAEVEACLRACSMAGFQGRPNKEPDVCYSWWIGATLQLVYPKASLKNGSKEIAFIEACQHGLLGGISNWPGHHPDIYHTYLGLAALSLEGHPQLKRVDAALNVSVHALQHWRSAVPCSDCI